MNEQYMDRDSGYGIVYYSNLDDVEPIFTKMDHNRLYDVFMLRNTIVSKEKSQKITFVDLESIKLPPRTDNVWPCRFCDVKDFCVTLNTLQYTYNTSDKKKAFVLKFENENKKNLDEISGLMEYKNKKNVVEAKRRSAQNS